MDRRYKIIIAGAGGMGSAAGLILKELGSFAVDLHLGDSREDRAQAAADWIRAGSDKPGEVTAFHLPPDGSTPELDGLLHGADLLLDCLPGEQAPRMARLARRHRLHYANLTEHVQETAEVRQIAAGADRGYILQTGLAPGFVDVLAHDLFQRFCADYGVAAVERIVMRVGALTTVAEPPHFYGFTWSSIGVATEYVEPSTVVRDFVTLARPSLDELRPVVIDGVVYEEALTSGGAADLPEALAGRVKDLDYKTLRYPGHFGWVKGVLDGAPAGVDRVGYLHDRMRETVPFVDTDDLVVILAAVEGRDADGVRRRLESTRRIAPRRVGHHRLKAIQATTSAALAEAAGLLLTHGHQGVCLQSQIDPHQFLSGPFVGALYG